MSTYGGLRDRVLIGLMVYSFARIGAAPGMTVEDVYMENRRCGRGCASRVASGTRCRANLEEYSPLTSTAPDCAAIPRGRCSARSVAAPPSSPARLLPQTSAYAMIRLRAAARRHRNQARQPQLPGDQERAYLKNGGTLEKAVAMVNNASTRTTQALRPSAKRGKPR
jgi:hypothetical protein